MGSTALPVGPRVADRPVNSEWPKYDGVPRLGFPTQNRTRIHLGFQGRIVGVLGILSAGLRLAEVKVSDTSFYVGVRSGGPPVPSVGAAGKLEHTVPGIDRIEGNPHRDEVGASYRPVGQVVVPGGANIGRRRLDENLIVEKVERLYVEKLSGDTSRR